MEARLRRPFRIGGMGLVEIGDYCGGGLAGRHQGEQDASDENAVEGYDVSPWQAANCSKKPDGYG